MKCAYYIRNWETEVGGLPWVQASMDYIVRCCQNKKKEERKERKEEDMEEIRV